MTREESEKRTYLLRTMCAYLDAAVYQAPDKLKLASNVRATYNGEETAVGDNELWKQVLRFPSRQTFVDPVTMNAVFYGTATNEAILDNGSHGWPKPQSEFKWQNVRDHNRDVKRWWHYLLRLQVNAAGEIEEIEEVTVENNLIHFNTSPAEYPLRNLDFDIPIPVDQRMDRDGLIHVVESYFDAVAKIIDPKDSLVHPDCQRIELGDICTNNKAGYQSVSARFDDPTFFYWNINNRRYPVVDPALGVVCAFVEFERILPQASPGWICSEAFKIQDGLYREILCTHKPMCEHGGWKGVDRYFG